MIINSKFPLKSLRISGTFYLATHENDETHHFLRRCFVRFSFDTISGNIPTDRSKTMPTRGRGDVKKLEKSADVFYEGSLRALNSRVE